MQKSTPPERNCKQEQRNWRRTSRKAKKKHEKAVPILTRVVEELHTLTPKEQNDLLKMIIDKITYKKTESGAGIKPTLDISLKI